jgi:phosphate:Na+ symporter
LTLGVERPSANSSLHVGAVGDTLRITLTLEDADARAVRNTRVHVRPSGPGLVPLAVGDDVVTDDRGEIRLPVLLVDSPGDYVLFATVPGEDVAPVEVPLRVLRESWFGFLLMGVAGGLALFLYGMRLIGRGLEKAAGGKLREFLASMTASPVRSLVFGTVSTLMVQSSSASTVLLVSFASAGLVSVGQCLGAVLGAAVGSTFTVQLIAFRISDFALLLVGIGVLMTMSRGRRRRVGGILLGFGLIFYGLQVMSEAMSPLKGMPAVTEFFFAAARNPIPALLVAVLFTGVAQASAATIGIILGLAFQGILNLESAMPFVLGANVGTAATAILASLNENTDGKRVAWAHAAFRIVGVLVFLPLLGPFTDLVQRLPGDVARQVANAHTLLNVATAILLFPAIPLAERALRVIIPDREPEEEVYGPKALDPRFHEQPAIALASAVREVLRMGGLVTEMLDDVKESLRRNDARLAQSIREQDDKVDVLDEEVTKYLCDLSTEYLSQNQSRRVLDLLFITKDLELIADIV